MAYHSVAKCTSFDSTAGTDFDIVLYNNNTGLWYFMMNTLMGGIAKTIFSDSRIRINNYSIAYFTAIVNSSIRINNAVIAYLYVFTNMNTRINYTTVADLYPIRYCYKYGEVYATSNNLEGIAAWVPGSISEFTTWRMIRSGAIFPGIRMGAKIGKKMGPVFEPIVKDRKEYMKGKHFIYLFIIGVLTEFQGQGFGGQLLHALVDICDKSKIPIYLETEIQQYVKLYEKFGFKSITTG